MFLAWTQFRYETRLKILSMNIGGENELKVSFFILAT